MEAAVTEKVGEVEVFRQMARSVHGVVRRNAEGFSEEESLIQPQPEGNCLNWVVGHLLRIYESVLPALGQEPVLENGGFERYKRGSDPVRSAGEAIELTALMAAWDEAARRIDAGLAALTAERLDEKAPFSPGNNPNETVRTLLTTVFFHQAYHAGQTGLLRRIAGKPGAIK
ncbi:MAG TPA: DinB family protein [Acidobacteriaceae bacterium]|nr:DinB family protein [Acidobacteriaceae bacterium]